jgi:hypothetical protein
MVTAIACESVFQTKLSFVWLSPLDSANQALVTLDRSSLSAGYRKVEVERLLAPRPCAACKSASADLVQTGCLVHSWEPSGQFQLHRGPYQKRDKLTPTEGCSWLLIDGIHFDCMAAQIINTIRGST